MSNLQHRQQKIQAKQKTYSYREFLIHRASWKPLSFSKNKGKISRYPETERINSVDMQEYEQLRESFLEHGNIGSRQDFLRELLQLSQSTPSPRLIHYTENSNCDFSDCVFSSRNAYLSSTVIKDVENVLYCLDVRYSSRNVYNSLQVINHSENVYQSTGIVQSFNIFYSRYIKNCNNIWFSSNLTGCSECLLCNDLQNVTYAYKNKIYTKEEYLHIKEDVLHEKDIFNNHYHDLCKILGLNYLSDNVSGNFIVQSSDVENGNLVYGLKKGKNVAMAGSEEGDEEYYNTFIVGRAKHFYGVTDSGNFSEHCYISTNLIGCTNVFYSQGLESCSFCLGCIGLKNKSYCILNKQYTKEERYEKVDEIFGQMEKDGILGDFFPATMNPFYFNDTAAYLIDPTFTKEEVTAKGYLWRDEVIKVDIPADAQIVSTSELDQYEGYDADGKRTINPSILDKVIQDPQGNVYKIVKMELAFLIKHGLPLPRKHWLDRMKENFRIG